MNEMPYRLARGAIRARTRSRSSSRVDRREPGAHSCLTAPVVRDLTTNRQGSLEEIGPVEGDDQALLAELPAAQKVSVRLTTPDLTVEGKPSGRAKRTPENRRPLSAPRADRDRPDHQGRRQRLDLIEALLGDSNVPDVSSVVLPEGRRVLPESRKETRAAEVSRLLREGRELVESVERLVCMIYGLSDELTNEVVAHAMTRAGSSQPEE